RQFEPAELEDIFSRADYMRDHSKSLTGRRRLLASHNGLMLATMFYEPSTRTRLSFEFAAERLGIRVRGTENAAEFSSATKGETIEDSTRVIAGYADMIVMRHKENGAAERAASVSNVPVINAGDGTGEHPTQSLLDLYTIRHELGRLKDLTIVAVGDLKHGRTVRSLVQLLALYPNNQVTFVSPEELRIGDDVKQYLTERKVTFKETGDIHEALARADVVYQTRTQKERHTTGKEPAHKPVKDKHFVIGQKELGILKQDAIIMHPLPRVSEIETIVDADPRAAYFRQAENGLYVRMALLDALADGHGQ
ncbi:MAG: aspartate carbamoyltransferase, partial [Patescibacteria group bacterium]